MKTLCIHFKGGVGKSTTAVHIAGVMQTEGKTLLIDGDRQVTSYKFFNEGQAPADFEILDINSEFSIVPLYLAEPTVGHNLSARIRKILKTPFSHLVVDTTPDPFVANQIISELEPDLVLIPVKHDDPGGHTELKPLLETIDRMRVFGIAPRVKIVPLGGSAETITPYTAGVTLDFEVTETVPMNHALFGEAVFKDFSYAWNFPGQESLYALYRSIALDR